jgi:hypothetical protein
MALKSVDRLGPFFQRVDQGLTFTKNTNHTMASTSGNALTVLLYTEANSKPILTSGTDVTSGSPTGAAADTTINIVIDTLTGITLTEDTWFQIVVKDDAGNVLLPNAITANEVYIRLRKQPA